MLLFVYEFNNQTHPNIDEINGQKERYSYEFKHWVLERQREDLDAVAVDRRPPQRHVALPRLGPVHGRRSCHGEELAHARYMDDLVLVDPDKWYLERVLREVRCYARDELGLELNDKTQTHPLSREWTT